LDIRVHLKKLFSHYKIQSVIGVACSGGIDSVVLLDAVIRCFPDYRVVLLYVNHNAREDSSSEEKFVRELAEKYEIKIEVRHFKFQSSGNFENEARKFRYNFFEEWAEQNKGVVFTAHHRNDQVETLWFRIIRGTGINGLVGIREKRGKIYRPLLRVGRKEIESYAGKHNLNWYADPTNDETKYLRNALRHDILPDIEKYFGENSPDRILMLLDDIEDMLESRENIFRYLRDNGFIYYCSGQIILVKSLINLYFSAFMKYLLETAINDHLGYRFYFSNQKWKEIKQLWFLRGPRKIQLSSELDFWVYGKEISIQTREPIANILVDISRVSEKKISWGDWLIDFNIEESFLKSRGSELFLRLDYDKLPCKKLKIGRSVKGSRYKKANNVFLSEVTKVLADTGIPLPKRRRIPLLYCGERIAGGAYLGIADDYKVTDNTKKILTVNFKEKGCDGRDTEA
jgi:tRNA(Ile)-lysidine synthase